MVKILLNIFIVILILLALTLNKLTIPIFICLLIIIIITFRVFRNKNIDDFYDSLAAGLIAGFILLIFTKPEIDILKMLIVILACLSIITIDKKLNS